ncbi:MAG: DUF6544 family protein [Mariniphaga sp.]
MNFLNKYKTEVQKRLKPISDTPILTHEDIQSLPAPVQKYLIYVGAIGKPKIQNVRVVWSGAMKRNRKSGWMPIASQQYNFFEEPSRFFYIRAKMFGIPFDGLHVYAGNTATMQIKVASMFQVVDAFGEKMSHGETVTVFNDMCFFAPSTLISKNIEWETIDSLTVKAKFTNDKITVSAILKFNQQGELIDFISDDRFYCEDGKTYLSYRWSTPIKNYIEKDGRKMPSYGEAIWHIPFEGEFCYAKFDLKEIEYNCTDFKY